MRSQTYKRSFEIDNKFIFAGASKKEILRKIKNNEGFEYPAARVKLQDSKVVWILDGAAAEDL